MYKCIDYSTGTEINFGEIYKEFIDMIQKERAKRIVAENEMKVQILCPKEFIKTPKPAEKENPENTYRRS